MNPELNSPLVGSRLCSLSVNVALHSILTKMSGIKRFKKEITSDSDHEAESDTGDEDIGKIRKANVAPKLTCMGCNGFYRGSVKYCKNNHGVCSACLPGDKKECPVTGCGQNALVTLDFPAELVKELKFPVSCKFKKDGCDQENADEEVIADHEIECGTVF